MFKLSDVVPVHLHWCRFVTTNANTVVDHPEIDETKIFSSFDKVVIFANDTQHNKFKHD